MNMFYIYRPRNAATRGHLRRRSQRAPAPSRQLRVPPSPIPLHSPSSIPLHSPPPIPLHSPPIVRPSAPPHGAPGAAQPLPSARREALQSALRPAPTRAAAPLPGRTPVPPRCPRRRSNPAKQHPRSRWMPLDQDHVQPLPRSSPRIPMLAGFFIR
jgi:hypothetical protein